MAHTNPHTWYYGEDALFVDPISYARLSSSEIKNSCDLLTQFIDKAFSLQVTKYFIKKEVGGKHSLL